MRDIKFRAYWCDKIVPVFAVNPMNHTVYLSHQQLYNKPGDDVLVKWNDGIEEDGCELMQYTGLKDKNGTEIYDGDVLSTKNNAGFEHRDTLELGWSKDGRYGFKWSRSQNTVLEQDTIDERYEIIGNIYENPELLERSSDDTQ